MIRLALAGWLTAALLGSAHAGAPDLFRAMEQELDRSMRTLRLDTLDTPYYLAYAVMEEESIMVTANFGAVVHSSASKNRQLSVNLRVGDYRLDNRNFKGRRGSRLESASLPVEDDPQVIRRAIWLATDRAYKQAVEEMSSKRAAMEKQLDTGDVLDDFSQEPPVTHADGPLVLDVDRAEWERRIRAAGAGFRAYPKIETSDLVMRSIVGRRFFLDSEKRNISVTKFLFTLEINAAATTPDGQTIRQKVVLEESDTARLPSEETLREAVTQVAGRINRFYDAPVATADYIGPVILSPEAAAIFFRYALVPHLSGGKPPLFENAKQAQRHSAGDFFNRVGQKIMPDFLNVVDDPGPDRFQDQALIGSYRIDQEGVAAQRVEIVKNGILGNFLMSRTPMKGFGRSNGHGRGQPWSAPEARIGCLYVTGKDMPFKDLWEKFLELCREEDLPEGYFIASMGPPVSPSTSEDVIVLSFGGGSREKNALALYEVYRVNIATGDSVPVRGLEVAEPNSRDLRLIAAAGGDLTPVNFWDSRRNSGQLPASLICPSLILKEMEFSKSQPEKTKPPLLPHPSFDRR